jgi:glycosyltransferase involved in cell wall biosynthesis
VRIAYLINRYPAVSHSFIRREIREIGALGAEVARFTIRPPAEHLPDAQDQAERKLTRSILGQGLTALLLGALSLSLAHPRKAANGLGAALKMSGPDPRRLLRHIAYFVESAWLAKRMKEEGVEHLHAHFGTNPAAVARIAHRLSGIPYSFTVHGPDEFDSPVALDLAGKIAEARATVAISSYGRSQLMRWSAPEHWPKLSIVRCGLDDSYFDAPLTPPAAEPRLCCVARLSAQKGLPLLIDTCALLKARGRRFTLTLVGDGELRQQLQAQVAREGLEQEVLFAGACDAEGVRRHLAQCRAFVLPSFAEGLPVVLMEALAMGRPVITTAIAGIPELVDEACGWLIPAGSADALADAIAEALDAPPERLAEMGGVGRARVSAMHSARRNAAELLDLIGRAK